MLSLSPPALYLLSLMDGTRSTEALCRQFHLDTGHDVSLETVNTLIDHLETARFLEGERFEVHYASLLSAYRSRGVRDMPHAFDLGVTDGSGAVFDEILADAAPRAPMGVVRGVVAPHLDYPRGRPCYGSAYAALRDRPAPDRVIILGTNHFGRSTSVVLTGNDFETPLGRTAVDGAFIEALEARCGDLRRYELDHQREHSIELQVGFVQHLFGTDAVTIVPVLCPDPCRPTGTAPYDGQGVDLKDFAKTLRTLIEADEGRDTLLIAGADLSHVGANFGDERALDEDFLDEVRTHDRAMLKHLEANEPDVFVQTLASQENPTRVCSAGCLFVIRTVLRGATAHILRYHQAVDQSTQCCVTCAAVALVEPSVEKGADRVDPPLVVPEQ